MSHLKEGKHQAQTVWHQSAWNPVLTSWPPSSHRSSTDHWSCAKSPHASNAPPSARPKETPNYYILRVFYSPSYKAFHMFKTNCIIHFRRSSSVGVLLPRYFCAHIILAYAWLRISAVYRECNQRRHAHSKWPSCLRFLLPKDKNSRIIFFLYLTQSHRCD